MLKLVVARLLSSAWREEHKRRRKLTKAERHAEDEENRRESERRALATEQVAELSMWRTDPRENNPRKRSKPGEFRIGFQEDLNRKLDGAPMLYVSQHYPATLRTKLRETFKDFQLTHDKQLAADEGAVPVLLLFDHTEEPAAGEPPSFFDSQELVALACALTEKAALAEKARLAGSETSRVAAAVAVKLDKDGSAKDLWGGRSTPASRQATDHLSATSCVKLYSCRQGFVAFKEQGQQWASAVSGSADVPAALTRMELSKGMFSVLWSQWPRDPTLQKVGPRA